MTQVQPAVPDRQSYDNPQQADDQVEVHEHEGVKYYDFKYRTSALGVFVSLFGYYGGYHVLGLDLQVRDSLTVRRPDRVYVQGPPNWWLRVTVRRPAPGEPPERADVVQYGYQMVEDTVQLPPDWFSEGCYVQVERTQPFEPRPAVAAADQRVGWL
jgi:hypothetical protein